MEPDNSVAGSAKNIRIRTGDAYFEDAGLSEISLLKVDVEGFEPFVFRGLARTLRRCRPPVLMELLDETRRVVGDEAGLRSLFYDACKIYSVERARNGGYNLKPFSYLGSREILVLPNEIEILGA